MRSTPLHRSATEWPIQEVARRAGTTSRALRHYDAVGLLRPSRVGTDGRRWYDEDDLVRLQRILVLRELGMGLSDIAAALAAQEEAVPALRRHLAGLDAARRRLDRQRASVARTISALEEGGTLVPEEMFDGFDHTQHREEVTRRWGTEAYEASDRWWRGLSDADRTGWAEESSRLGRDWAEAAASGEGPDGAVAQDLARRHCAWLAAVPGTPGHGNGAPAREYVLGLAEMYVADPRFTRAYGGPAGARLVRDALRVHLGTPAGSEPA